MSASQPTGKSPSGEWRTLAREQLVDYGRMLALGNELLEVLRTYPGPAKLKDISGRRDSVLRSLQRRAERMEEEGILIGRSGGEGLPQKARAELRRALESVLEVEKECRKLHEMHLENLRRGIQELQDARNVARIYGQGGRSQGGPVSTGVNIND